MTRLKKEQAKKRGMSQEMFAFVTRPRGRRLRYRVAGKRKFLLAAIKGASKMKRMMDPFHPGELLPGPRGSDPGERYWRDLRAWLKELRLKDLRLKLEVPGDDH